MRRSCAFVALAAALVVAHPYAQQSNGLPDRDAFLAEARKRLAGNEVLQNRYTYRERVTRVRFNPVGHIGTGPVDVYEVYPVAEELTYRRLVERNGVPVPRAELARSDGEFLARYHKWRRDLQREGQTEREARLRREAAERQKDRAQAEEAIGLFDFTIERRDSIDGQPAIVIAFRPKPNAKPRSREAKIASSFAGLAYVHEHEYQLLRVEAEAVSDTSFGYGVVAKLHKGAKAVVRRQKIAGVWLPVETRMDGTGRALLFRKVAINYRREYSDYRRFEPSDLATLLASARSSR
jgi:hypothetical protein